MQEFLAAQSASWVGSIAKTMQSNSKTERYGGVGNAPIPTERKGGMRVLSPLQSYELYISNREYQATIEIAKRDLSRDKTGQLMPKIQGLASRAVLLKEDMLSKFINAGEATTYGTGLDGLELFKTAHALKGYTTAQSNSISVDISALPCGDTVGTHGSTTDPSAQEIAWATVKAVQQLRLLKDDQGQPANENIGKVVVMVPGTYSAAAEMALTFDRFPDGGVNPLYGSKGYVKELVVNQRLDWTTKFAVFISDGQTSPLIIQEEDPVSFMTLAEGSEWAKLNSTYLFGTDWAGYFGYYDFSKACLVTLT